MLGDSVRCSVLCASDPYAVLGVQHAFGFQPDLVTGPTANTDAGIALVARLTGLRALNLVRSESLPELRRVIEAALAS